MRRGPDLRMNVPLIILWLPELHEYAGLSIAVYKMTFLQNFFEAMQSLRMNVLRTLLTMLGIIIGVAALITMLSVGSGAQATIMRQIDTLGANLLMVIPRAEHNANGASVGRVRPTQLTLYDVETLRTTIPELISAAPALQGQVRLVYNNRNWSTGLNGTTAEYFFIRDWSLAGGREFSRREETGAGKVAIIGATVAERLFGEEDPIGQEVRILNASMQIIGVLTEKGQSGSGKDQDDIVFVPYKTALLRLGADSRRIAPDSVSYILAKAASNESVAAAKIAMDTALRQQHRIADGADAGFRVVDPVATMTAQRGSARTIAWLLAAIASISLIVGGISIMNIMLVSVTERTREIGLRLALGARRRDISRLFLAEALLICSLGGMIGVTTGVGSSWLIAKLLNWPILISPSTVLFALISSAAIGLFFGYFPARKAAGLLPAIALRTE